MKKIIKNISFVAALLTEAMLILAIIPQMIEDGNITGLIISLMLVVPLYLFLGTFSYEEVKDALGITWLEKWCQKHS